MEYFRLIQQKIVFKEHTDLWEFSQPSYQVLIFTKKRKWNEVYDIEVKSRVSETDVCMSHI